jgi:hypothetical protein
MGPVRAGRWEFSKSQSTAPYEASPRTNSTHQQTIGITRFAEQGNTLDRLRLCFPAEVLREKQHFDRKRRKSPFLPFLEVFVSKSLVIDPDK